MEACDSIAVAISRDLRNSSALWRAGVLRCEICGNLRGRGRDVFWRRTTSDGTPVAIALLAFVNMRHVAGAISSDVFVHTQCNGGDICTLRDCAGGAVRLSVRVDAQALVTANLTLRPENEREYYVSMDISRDEHEQMYEQWVGTDIVRAFCTTDAHNVDVINNCDGVIVPMATSAPLTATMLESEFDDVVIVNARSCS